VVEAPAKWWLHVAVLSLVQGLTQGLTEVLTVSSSGCLAITSRIPNDEIRTGARNLWRFASVGERAVSAT